MPQRARIVWNGDHVKRIMRAAAVKGLTKAGEHLLSESRDKVPLEEGTLERSGEVVVDEDKLTATVVYDTPYAVRQHEEMDYQHAPGRQAKYLEEPFNAERDTMQKLVAAELRRAVEG